MHPILSHVTRVPNLLKCPLSVIEWTHLSRLQPSRDTVKVERMITLTPSDRTILRCRTLIVGLTLDTQIPEKEWEERTSKWHHGHNNNESPIDIRAIRDVISLSS